MDRRVKGFGRVLRRHLAAWWMCLLALHAGAALADLSKTDALQVRSTIEAQLKAFAADDAAQAFSFAAPEIQKMFGTADVFLAMVRKSYPMVYRPATYAFLAPTEDEGDVEQKLQIADADGANWTAIYHLKRQPDGAWRIASCQVMNGSGKFVRASRYLPTTPSSSTSN